MGMDIEVNPGPVTDFKSLSMVHMNIQSLYMSSINNNPRVKLDEVITTFAIDAEIDIITMSETWLHESISNNLIKIPGYREPYRNDRKDRRGGGVCAYVSDNVTCKRLKELEPPDIDLLWLELTFQRKRVVLGIGYRPPGQNQQEVETFLDQFGISLTKINNLGAESVVILGDFNDTCVEWDDDHMTSDLKRSSMTSYI
jgi:hypothetical protein